MKGAFIRVRNAMGGYVATLKGQRATCTWSHEEAARRVARKVYGEKVDVVNDYLTEADVAAGVQYRYHVTHTKALGPKDPPRVPGYRPYA